MLSELGMFARYARALSTFFAEEVTLEQARNHLAEGLRNREQNLLDTIRRGVWETPHSPYLPLFRHAGIERGDAEKLIRQEGVDEGLRKLRSAGVYVTIDEFKGKRPIQRPGLEYKADAEDFDNPLLNVHFEGRTGGSGGVRRRLLIDLSVIASDAAAHRVVMDSLGTAQFPSATWRAVPPNNSGLKKPLMGARVGVPLDRWFSELPTRWTPSEFKYAAFTAFTVAAARACGRRFPYPEHVTREQVGVIVRWMADMAAAGTPVYMDCSASAAVRLASAAVAAGRDLTGSVIRTGSEPLTEARAAVIRQCGARVVVGYAASESGPIGMACPEAVASDHVHVLMHKMAAVHSYPEDAQPGRENILYLTTIIPSCPKIMLNVDTGDSGVLERRSCGCELGKIGLDLHLHNIRSHEKLTSEGILLPASEIVRLMEEVMPAACGGAPTDYQLIEDGRSGMPQVRIAVSPRVGTLQDADVVTALLNGIRAGGAGGRLMADQLEQARCISVVRQEPIRSPIGKMLPLFVVPKE